MVKRARGRVHESPKSDEFILLAQSARIKKTTF
jgi:hypothetical protein